MFTLETRRVLLCPIKEADLSLLHRWRNDPIFIGNCSIRRNSATIETFAEELKHDFSRDRHLQFIVSLKRSEIPIGTLWSYNLNLLDGHVFLSVFLESLYQNRGYGAEAVALVFQYLFESFPLHKIYMEAYSYNHLSLSTLQKAKFIVEEGRFKEHRYFNGQRWDLFRYAVYRNSLDKISDYVDCFKILKERG